MAVDSGIVWEIRTSGDQANGGGFKTGASGVDKSQQAAAEWALDPVTSSGGTATMTNANAHGDMVGNICYVVSGTNATTGWYEIVSVDAGVGFDVDRNWCTGACNNGVVNVGGAWKIGGNLDDNFFEAKTAGNIIYIESGTYNAGEDISTSTNGTAALSIQVIGYVTTRSTIPIGTDRPLINLSDRWVGGSYWRLFNLRLVGSNASQYVHGAGTFGCGQNLYIENTHLTTTKGACEINPSGRFVGCEAKTLKGIGFKVEGVAIGCYARACDKGFEMVAGAIVNCVAVACQYGAWTLANDDTVTGCTFRGCRVGYRTSTYENVHIVNNIFADNFVGFETGGAKENVYFDYNCWHNNTTDMDPAHGDKGEHAVDADPDFTSAVVEGTDGATDGAGTTFTAASNPFGDVTIGDVLVIVEAGTGATLGAYDIVAVPGAGEVTLDRSAGANKTGIDYRLLIDERFTLGDSSNAADAGVDAGTFGGCTV